MLRALIVVTLLAFFGFEGSRRLFGSNFHTVVPGRVYRGAQPSAPTVAELARTYGIRTIVNLRGCGVPLNWYMQEAQSAQQLGLEMEDVCFSALRLPSSLELRRLVEVLDNAKYPIFFHCRRGSDRTGMAAAIAMLLSESQEGKTSVSLAQARSQLGIYYAHVALGKTRVLDDFFDLYQAWLLRHGRAHEPEIFRHWLLHEYKGGWCSAAIEEFTPLAPVARVGEPIGYKVRLRNTGTRPWRLSPNSESGNHLAYQVWDGANLLAEGRAGLCDKEVPPGQDLLVTLVINPLGRAGHFRLLADMVEEKHCWFYQTGSEPHEEELIVVQ